MVNKPKKAQRNSNAPQNNSNKGLKLDSSLSKSRKQIYAENYQKNKGKKKQQRRERYQQQKELAEQQQTEQQSKYYGAEAFKILMSLKEYTELNQEKRKLWLNFMWTFKDLNKLGTPHDIIQVMKLREDAENLINDYWTTAKNEIKKGKSWNSLDYDQQQRLIKYWGYEKARIKNNYISEEERLEKQSQAYLKEIELTKFHEERGKVKCLCYQCQESKRIQSEIKAELFKESQVEKEQCPECNRWVKELDEESGVCRKCLSKYE
jgi:hypothetical protein